MKNKILCKLKKISRLFDFEPKIFFFPFSRLYSWGAKKVLVPIYNKVVKEAEISMENKRNTDIKILDVGCGPGLLTHLLSNSFNGKIIGLDASKDMIRIARKRYSEPCVKNVEFINSTIEEVTFPSNYFDLVVICFVLHHLQNRKEIIEKIHDILMPGGILLIFDFNNDVSKASIEQWRRSLGLIGFLGRGAINTSIEESFNKKDLIQWISRKWRHKTIWDDDIFIISKTFK